MTLLPRAAAFAPRSLAAELSTAAVLLVPVVLLKLSLSKADDPVELLRPDAEEADWVLLDAP